MTIQSLGTLLQSIHASNLSSLATYTGAQPGMTAYVDTLKCEFVATPSATTAADGYSVLDGYSVQWQRVAGSSSAYWLKQNTWYIDGYMGNDEADGYTSVTALKTTDEIQRRWGPNPIIQTSATINILSVPNTNIINLNIGRNNIDYNITIQGSNTILLTTTLTTYTLPSAVNNEVHVITATGITDWTPYLYMKINFGVNGFARIAAVNPSGLGNNWARITVPVIDAVNNYSNPNWQTATPTIGQTITIESLGPDVVNININTFGINGIHNYNGTYKRPFIILKSLQTSQKTQLFSTTYKFLVYNANFRIIDCDFEDLSSFDWCAEMFGGSVYYMESSILKSILMNTLIRNAITGNYSNNLYISSYPGAVPLNNVLSEKMTLLIYDNGVIANGTYLASFDSPAHGIQIHNGGSVYITGFLLGKNNATFGYRSGSNGTLMSGGATLKITGTSGDWQCSTTSQAFTWTNSPTRKFASGSGTATLVGGTIAVTVEALPADAIVSFSRKTSGGTLGEINISAQSTSGFTLTSSSALDTSIINWSWNSPGAGIGGIVAS